jgi:parvulin-like peptidyl-prolyl isomerase
MIRRVIPLALIAFIIMSCNTKKDIVGSAIVVNGKSIAREKVDKLAVALKENLIRAYPQKMFNLTSEKYTKAASYQIVSNEALLIEAKKQNISFTTAFVDSNFELIKKRFPNDSTFISELAKAGKTADEMKAQVGEGMVIDSLVKKVMNTCGEATEDDIKVFYEKNISKYIGPTKMRASQILFPVDSTTPASKTAELQKYADDALVFIKGGKNIDAAAKKFKSKGAVGGDIGWFQKGDMKPEIEIALASLKENEVSNVIRTDIGFQIFQKTGEEIGKTLPLDEVKDHAKYMTNMQKRNEFVSTYIDSLVKSVKVVYNDTTLTPLSKGAMDSLFMVQ